MKTIRFTICAFLIILAYAAVGAAAGPSGDTSTRIILKVNPGVIVMPDGERGADLSDIEVTSDRVAELNEAFGLMSIERVFPGKPMGPEEVVKTGLQDIYLLTFPEGSNAGEIVSSYSAASGVIYAEEDRTVTIY